MTPGSPSPARSKALSLPPKDLLEPRSCTPRHVCTSHLRSGLQSARGHGSLLFIALIAIVRGRLRSMLYGATFLASECLRSGGQWGNCIHLADVEATALIGLIL